MDAIGNKSDGVNQVQSESAASKTLDLAHAARVDLFCNQLDVPYMRIPSDEHQPDWPLRSPRVRAWLCDLYHEKTKHCLRSGDINAVLGVMEGQAWNANRRAPNNDTAWALIEESPVGRAIVSYVNANGEYAGKTSGFLKALIALAKRQPSIVRVSELPTVTQVFSRQINQLIPSLGAIGLDVAVTHQEDGSHCQVKLQPAFIRETDEAAVSTSDQPSVSSAAGQSSCEPADADDAISGTRRAELLTEIHHIGERTA